MIQSVIAEHFDTYIEIIHAEPVVDALAKACADGPLVDQERGLILHQTEPELAAALLEEAKVAEGWCDDMESPAVRQLANLLRRAARLVGGGL